MSNLKFDEVKKVLDDIAKAKTVLRKYENFICEHTTNIHMTDCVRDFSEVMGIPLTEVPFKCGTSVANEISFIYKGIRFFELEDYREVKSNDAAD